MAEPRKFAIARRQLDQRFKAAGDVPRHLALPAKGWIRAIRDSLGMTAAQLAARMGITQPSLTSNEKAEIKGSIQISTLKRAAEAMNCTLVYALVPNDSLEDFFQSRAQAAAAEQLKPILQTMLLEGQSLSPKAAREQLDDYIRTRLDPRSLWDTL